MLRLVLLLALGLGLAGCADLPLRDSDVPTYCPKYGGRMPQC